jgi:hypothetical protein
MAVQAPMAAPLIGKLPPVPGFPGPDDDVPGVVGSSVGWAVEVDGHGPTAVSVGSPGSPCSYGPIDTSNLTPPWPPGGTGDGAAQTAFPAAKRNTVAIPSIADHAAQGRRRVLSVRLLIASRFPVCL